MTQLISTQCSRCGAALGLYPGQRHVRCSHCGTAFVVESRSAGAKRSDSEPLLSSMASNMAYLLARARLEDLPVQIGAAQASLAAAERELDCARALEASTLRHGAEQQDRLLALNLGVVALAALCWLLALFVLGGPAAAIVLFLASALSMAAVGVHDAATRSEATTAARQDAAARVVADGRRTLGDCQVHLDDLRREQELCSARTSSYRFGEYRARRQRSSGQRSEPLAA